MDDQWKVFGRVAVWTLLFYIGLLLVVVFYVYRMSEGTTP